MRAAFRIGLSCALLLAGGLAARGDEVFLRNGSSIVGRIASEDGHDVVVAVPGGTVRLPRRDVDRVQREALPEDLYAERAAATDMSDPAAVKDLAAYAARIGLVDVARRLETTAAEVELERRVERIDKGDAAGFRDAAAFAHAHGLGRVVERYLYTRALEADLKDEVSLKAIRAIDAADRAERDRARSESDAQMRRWVEVANAQDDREAEDEARRRAEDERRRREEALPPGGCPDPLVIYGPIIRHHTRVVYVVPRYPPRRAPVAAAAAPAAPSHAGRR
jgi:hypothetical protein